MAFIAVLAPGPALVNGSAATTHQDLRVLDGKETVLRLDDHWSRGL